MKRLHTPGLIIERLVVGLSVVLEILNPRHASAQIGPTPTNYVLHPVRITYPPNHAVFLAPATIPIFAYARDLSTVIGISSNSIITNVEFYANGVDLGPGHHVPYHIQTYPPTIPLNQWEFTWSNALAGPYALTAIASNEGGHSFTSAPVNITVLTPPPPPTNVPPIVSIVACDPIAIEGTNCWIWRGLTNATPVWSNWPPVAGWAWFTNCGPKNGAFTVLRFGVTNDDLTVTYTIGGTATNGVDYMALSNSVTIPAGQRSAQITVVPLDDGKPDLNSTVILSLNPDTNAPPDYLLGYPRRAAVFIIDSDRPRPTVGMLRDDCFHLAATGPDGAWFSVQYSTDMVNWTPICTNQVVEGSIDFIDPDAPGDSSRLYRAVPLPAGPF